MNVRVLYGATWDELRDERVQEDVHQRVPNNYRLFGSSKRGGTSRRKERTYLRYGDKSLRNVLFFFFFLPLFFSSPFLEEKEPSFLTSGYISDPKSIKHRPIKFSFVKGKPKRSVLLNLAIGNALGKMVNKINRNRLEKRREGKIFTDTFLLFLPFFFFPSFLPSPIDFYLPRGRSIDVNENIGISLLGKFVASSSCKTVWSMDRRASDRKLCVSLSSAPEVTARRHTDHATICRFADCIFFRAALPREEKLGCVFVFRTVGHRPWTTGDNFLGQENVSLPPSTEKVRKSLQRRQ